MSFIYNKYVCGVCNNEVKYSWLFADKKFEVFPDKSKYVIASIDREYTKYKVCVKCPKCNNITCFSYSLDGKYQGLYKGDIK